MTITLLSPNPHPLSKASASTYTGPLPRTVRGTASYHLNRVDPTYSTARNGTPTTSSTTSNVENTSYTVENRSAAGSWFLSMLYLQIPVWQVDDDAAGVVFEVWLKLIEGVPWTLDVKLFDWSDASGPPMWDPDAIAAAPTLCSFDITSAAVPPAEVGGHWRASSAALDSAIQAAKAASGSMKVVLAPRNLLTSTQTSVAGTGWTVGNAEQAGRKQPRLVYSGSSETVAMFSGRHTVNYNITSSTSTYTPETGQWRACQSLGEGWDIGYGCRVGDYWYAPSSTRTYRYSILDDLWENFDAVLPTGLTFMSGGQTFAHGGYVYMISAFVMYRLNLATRQWSIYRNGWFGVSTYIPSVAYSGQGSGAVVDGDHVWLLGSNNHGDADRLLYRYHIPSDTAVEYPPCPLGKTWATLVIMEDRRLVAFGRLQPFFSYPVDAGTSGTWRYEGDTAVSRGDLGATVIGSGAYLNGGQGGTAEAGLERFTYGGPSSVGTPLEGGGGGGPSLRRPGTSNPPRSIQKSVRAGGRNTYL